MEIDYCEFRAEVRSFLNEHLTGTMREAGRLQTYAFPHMEQALEWQRVRHAHGWGAPAWPEEYGGTGSDSKQKEIFREESLLANAPGEHQQSLNMCGPCLIGYGSKAQKDSYLPRILSAEHVWCQGYSEPGAGSDLASLKTTAVRDGDHYVINGQKTWTTLAQHADWGFFLCRTDPDAAKPQEGISFILVDMNTPGIEVRPIITIDGGHEVNEVWLTDVRVPVENRVGEENQGWTYAKFLLAHERSGIAGVARSKRGIERLRNIASTELLDGEPLIEDDSFARKISQLEIDLTALEFTELRTLARESAGKGPGPESSILKVKGTEIQQRLTELTLEAVGSYGVSDFRGVPEDGSNEFAIGPDYAHHSAPTYFNFRKTSIYGGSNEIQRNIITKMILGL